MTRKSKLQIRVSDDEEQLIRLKMSEYGFRNLSDFIRTSIISPSDRNKVQLQPLLYEVNKIGVNLNQAIYLMHRKGILQAQNTHVQVLSKLLHEVDQLRINMNKLNIRSKSESEGQSDGGSSLPPMALRPR